MKKEKILVSACLLGHKCRYDGKSKKDETLLMWLEAYEVIPFCPEAPLFGTPRPKIYVVSYYKDDYRVIRQSDGCDVTQALKEQVVPYTTMGIKRAILKSKSPSCGLGTTPIFNRLHEVIALGDGLAALLFKEAGMLLTDETSYNNEKVKDFRC